MSKLRPMSRRLCLQCKGGRLLCGNRSCPLLAKIDLQNPVQDRLKEQMFGPSPSVFVGWNDYPSVYVGPMTSLEEAGCDTFDNPGLWYGMGFDDIIRARSLLVRGKQKHPIMERSRFVDEMQEIALSVRPVDVEAHYTKRPHFSLSFSPISQPMGASGELKSFSVADNPVIPQKVDSVVSDELTAGEQVVELFDRNMDVYYLSNVLSSGALGMEDAKRLVPTRWGITAVDDILGRELMKRIRDYPELPEIQVYGNTYLGNHFEILLIPGAWEFEQFEAWAPNTLWTMSNDQYTIVEEHEGHGGRWDYAYNEGGGYYAGRFAAAEALNRMGRQARCVIFREIYDSYVMPVGVWEVRENVRKALEKPPTKFRTLPEALDDISQRLLININCYILKSQILRQRRITDYTRFSG
ncbi:MAG: Nre family DNA repair protein [Candidatus Altiarchaeota archaeon]